MIPKIIHYCWFGGAPLPPLAERCIASWRRYFPDWEIRRWDESNYDVRATPYIAEAYDMRKYAFVSDVARFEVLYRYGGVYFDTDVEVLRNFDDVLARGPFMGQEDSNVAPGLGMAAEAGMPFLKELLEHYHGLHFADGKGRILDGTVVTHTTSMLLPHGYECRPGMQQAAGFTIYPESWFNPIDRFSKQLHIGPDTHSIHHYAASWTSPWHRFKKRVQNALGPGVSQWVINAKRRAKRLLGVS